MERLNGEVDGYADWHDFITTGNATASQKMFSSESYYTTFWEHSLHAMAIVNEEGKIIEANPAFCQLIGFESHQATGINIRNLVADGEFREDMRMIDTMFLGQMIEGVTEERWNFRLDSHGPYIPVRLKAMRIPANRNRPFKHIIIQVYDLRSTKYDMQGKNWSNKKTGELVKELLMTHFGKILCALMVLAIILGLNGALGETINKIINIWDKKENTVQVQYLPQPSQNNTQNKSQPYTESKE